MKKIISVILVLCLTLGMVPMVSAGDAPKAADHVVINEVYGGGGNSGAEYKSDFVELYNPTGADVDLTGWSIQYAASGGAFGSNKVTLTGSIKAGGYYLIQLSAGGGGTTELPTPDASGSINMSGTKGKVALVENKTDAISGIADTAVVDFVGFGAANEYEGTAPTGTLSATKSASRTTPGVDTDDNSADFTVGAPSPMNSGGDVVDPPDPPIPSITAIAEARKMAEGTVAVKGIVTYIDGKNVYIQDSEAGINIYGDAPAGIAIGDEYVVTGTVGEYNNLKQINPTDYEKQGTQTLPTAQEIEIADIGEDYESMRIKLTSVEVTAIDETYGNLTLSQNGSTIKTYKGEIPDTILVGDVLTVTAVVGQFGDNYQLYVVTEADITVVTPSTTVATPTASESGEVASGTKVTFSSATEGATIYYSTDNIAWTEGSEVTITGDITYYVKATKDGMDDSAVATFTFKLPAVVADPIKDDDDTIFTDDSVLNIEEALASSTATSQASGAAITVVGQLVYTTSSYGNAVLQDVIDGQVYSLFVYGSAPEDAVIGDIISMTGTFYIRYGAPQLAGVSAKSVVDSAEPMEAMVYTVEEVKANGLNMLGRYIKIEDVTIGEASGRNTPVTDGTGTINIYDAYDIPVGIEPNDEIDLYAMVSTYNSSVQLATGEGAYVLANDQGAPTITLPDDSVNAQVGEDYVISASVIDVSGVSYVGIQLNINGEVVNADMAKNADTGKYEYTVSGADITASIDRFTFTITATDASSNSNEASRQVTVMVSNLPQIEVVSPLRNSQTGADKTPTFEVALKNAGENPSVKIKIGDGTAVDMTKDAVSGNYTYTPTADLADGEVSVTVSVITIDGTAGRYDAITWSFTVGEAEYDKYFGQLHSHTTYSDGSGTLESALNYINNIPTSDNVDFVAFTDHSNSFDSSSAANPAEALNDASQMTAASKALWDEYTEAVDNFNAAGNDVSALSGFEMTWSGGPGHINTFNSEGLISRNNSTLNSKTDDNGMKAYYDALIASNDPLANLSQFNHPGTTFGNFADFGYYTPAYDSKMVMVEVANGEGAVGAGGYYPSYEQYTLALDKGWHVGPTNNQDNHKGGWGNANTARTVFIAESNSEEDLLTAMSQRAMYSTEDKNLEIDFEINGQMMGSIIEDVPNSIDFAISVYDPDNNDNISEIEIITGSGRVAMSKDFSDNSVTWDGSLDEVKEGYYYLRVTQADLNIAVTAPVWIGSAPLMGINSVEVSTKMPVTDEELTLTTTVFNSESEDKELTSITYKIGDTEIGSGNGATLATNSTHVDTFAYTPTEVGVVTITVEVLMDGQIYSQNVELNVRDADKLVYVGIDASNYNEYVNGNYKDSMGNFANLAAEYDVRVVELNTEAELIAATGNDKYKMLILTPPTRRDGSSLLDDYQNWTEAEINAITAFAEAGNIVVVTGWSDYYERYEDFPEDDHMAAQQNDILEALGSSLRISDDGLIDNTNNGGQAPRLYLTEINDENMFMQGIVDSQVYSNYGGATIYAVGQDGAPVSALPSSVSAMVYSFETGESTDNDGDNFAGVTIPKYDNKYLSAASESITYDNGNTATIITSGSVFMSNFEIQADLDNYGTPAYSNYTIVENLLKHINPVVISTIAEVHAGELGDSFAIRGTLTSNATGYDDDTAFFDSAYVQDATGGINLHPVADILKAGDVVEVKGTVSAYQGERQLKVTSISKIGEGTVPTAIDATAAQINDMSVLGSLVKVSGEITRIVEAEGIPQSIYYTDASGETARIFIDGYITELKTIENLAVGNDIEAVGLASYDNSYADTYPRIRIRDRDDIAVTVVDSGNNGNSGNSGSGGGNDDDDDVTIVDPTLPLSRFVDVAADAWYFAAVNYVVEAGIFEGTSAITFDPEGLMTRAMVWTVLARMSGVDTSTGAEWYTVGMEWAIENGVSDGTNPEGFITREQFATMLYRYAGSPELTTDVLDFGDADMVSDWARDAMIWATSLGIIEGTDNMLIPQGEAGRAQIAAMLMRYLG